MYRLGQLFDFFRMFSFFYTTVGYYVCTMVFCSYDLCVFVFSFYLKYYTLISTDFYFLEVCVNNLFTMQMTVLIVYIFLYGRAYLVSGYLNHIGGNFLSNSLNFFFLQVFLFAKEPPTWLPSMT